MLDNKPCSLLTQDENELIFSLLGYKCQSLATTVIELYIAGGRLGYEDWRRREMGVLCLVKDNNKRSYFFRLFCPLRRRMLWEHEVYNDMKYITPSAYLHTFEAEECIVGFNFASEEEGEFLNCILLEKLENKRQRRQEKRNRASVVLETNNVGVYNNKRAMPTINRTPVGVPPPTWSTDTPPASQASRHQKKRHHKLSKADIGTPKDFRHISHVGFDADRGFDTNNESLKEFLNKAGISERQLRDQETMDFIYDFIESHGGMEAVKTEVGPAPPIPERNSRARAPPPPPPMVAPAAPAVAPPAPVGPPPPPPIRTYPPRVPPTSINAVQPPPPPPMSGMGGGSAPVAPPMPPPPPVCPPPCDSGPSSLNSGGAPDPRSALMQAIKEGTNLKPVGERVIETSEKKAPQDSRGRLMEEIRDFKSTKLNTVQQTAEASTRRAPEGGLAGALAEALAKRAKVIQSESSSGSSGGEDDEEWDD